MSEDVNKEGQKDESGQITQDVSRSEQRHEDLATKLKEQEAKHSLELEQARKEKEEALAKASEALFESELLKQSQNYPQAMEHKDDIKSYTAKGLSVDEATTLVLGKAGKLQTKDQQATRTEGLNSFGGTSVTVNPSEKDPSEMTQEERRNALLKAETDGRFGIKDNSIFFG